MPHNVYMYIIKNETQDGSNSSNKAVAPTSPSSKTPSKPQAEPESQQSTSGQIMKTLKNNLVVREAVSIAKSELLYQANTVELRTGTKDVQQKIDFQVQMANMGLSVLGSAVAGFATGGLVGAAAMAGISVLTQAISFAQSTSQAQRTIDIKQSIENVSIGQQLVRAGSRGSRGGYNE